MLSIRYIELRDANSYIAERHRHHRPVCGHRFSLACYDGGTAVRRSDCWEAGCATDRPAKNGGSAAAVYRRDEKCV